MKPFPPDNVFEPLQRFDPIQINQSVKSNTEGTTLNQIDSILAKLATFLIK
jgi:hypothetical protein